MVALGWSAALVAVVLAGCGGDDRATAAADVVRAFAVALAAGDGAAACDLLAPATARELDDDDAICAREIGDAGLPPVGDVTSATVFGDAAQVRATGDVEFLTSIEGQWRITAAGCVGRPDDRPYDCIVED